MCDKTTQKDHFIVEYKNYEMGGNCTFFRGSSLLCVLGKNKRSLYNNIRDCKRLLLILRMQSMNYRNPVYEGFYYSNTKGDAL